MSTEWKARVVESARSDPSIRKKLHHIRDLDRVMSGGLVSGTSQREYNRLLDSLGRELARSGEDPAHIAGWLSHHIDEVVLLVELKAPAGEPRHTRSRMAPERREWLRLVLPTVGAVAGIGLGLLARSWVDPPSWWLASYVGILVFIVGGYGSREVLTQDDWVRRAAYFAMFAAICLLLFFGTMTLWDQIEAAAAVGLIGGSMIHGALGFLWFRDIHEDLMSS